MLFAKVTHISDKRHNKRPTIAYNCTVKSAFTIFMSLLVLVTTSGFTVSKHNCSTQVSDSVSKEHACTCGSNSDMDGCCSTEKSFYQLDDDFSVPPVQSLRLTQATLLAVVAYNLSFDYLLEEGETEYLNYKPPIPDKDIPVLIQAFLI